MRTVAWLNGIGKLTAPDLFALAHAAERIGTTTTNLAACIGFETGGTFDPAVPNRAGSGAVGEIQFMPSTMCALLGLPNTEQTRKAASARFAGMSFVEQLEYVVKYFSWFRHKDLSTLEALYCAIFWPAAIDKPDDYVIALAGAATYRQNAGFDLSGNRDGKITRAEVCAAVRRYRASGDDKPFIEIPDPDGGDTAPFTDAERAAVAALVDRTSAEATEEFRRGAPILPDDGPPEIPQA